MPHEADESNPIEDQLDFEKFTGKPMLVGGTEGGVAKMHERIAYLQKELLSLEDAPEHLKTDLRADLKTAKQRLAAYEHQHRARN